MEEPIFQMRKLRQCLIPLTWLGSWRAWGSAHPHGHWVPCPQCSTTCGLGAVWRLVRCSSGREEDCAPAGRPQPARRCHLRPCAAWHTGNWSKVREGGGWQPKGTSGALGPRPVFGISRSHHQSAGWGPCAQLCTLISSLWDAPSVWGSACPRPLLLLPVSFSLYFL